MFSQTRERTVQQPSTKETQESGYVFELLKDRSISFRRADIANPEAKNALAILLSLLFQVNVGGEDIENALVDAPKNCPYLSVMVAFAGNPQLCVSMAEKEPGRSSGNPVMTRVNSTRLH